MKFWHKLLALIAAIAATLISSIFYIEYRAAHDAARKIDAIGREVLSAQAESFLSKIISDQAGKAALKIDHVKDATLLAAAALSGNPALPDDDHRVSNLLNRIMTTSGKHFQQIFLAKSDGIRIFGGGSATPDNRKSHIAAVQAFDQYVTAPKAAGTWQEIARGGPGRKMDVFALTFQPLPAEGHSSAHLGAVISVSNLIREFNQDQPVKGSYTFLINEQGFLLAAPPNARYDLSPIPAFTAKGFMDLNQTVEPELKRALNNAALGQSAIEQVVIRGQLKFLAYRPVAGTAWRLCLVTPVSLATATSYRLSNFIQESSRERIKNLTIASLTLLLFAIGLAALLSRTLTRPLMEMEHATQKIADGDLEQTVSAKGTDEIGTLARSFNAMTQALEESMRQLSASKEDIANQLRMTTTLLETIPAPVYHKDSNGRITGCNSAFEKFFGTSRSEIMGKERYLHYPETVADFDLQQDQELISESGIRRYELQVPDGQGRDRYMIFNKAAITSSDKERLGMIGVLIDITDRIEADKSLRQYARIVSATSDLMSFIDQNYTYQAVNDAYLRAHGRKAEEIVGHTIPSLMGDFVFQDKIKGPIDECLGGKVVNYKAWFDFSKLGRRFMDVTYFPYYENDSRITGIVVDSRDITRTTELESQLRQASKMESIGTLAGGIAHDFNNILSPIIGFAELLQIDFRNEQPAAMYVDQILTASMRARELVKQILIFSRQADQEIKPIQIDQLVSEVLKLTRSTLPSTIEIKKDFKCKNKTILADATEIHQLTMNLITNAFHAMEETGGTLSVMLDEQSISMDDIKHISMAPGNYLCLTVADTGHGMNSHTREKIFDPYFTTKSVDKGTGLGLAVAHGVVKSYGGAITVDSEVGMGTTFKIYLPLETLEEETAPAQPGIELQGGSEHILVVDDEIMVAGLVATILENLGYRVTQCTDSEEAYFIYEKDPEDFDLVISDLTMPKMTGIELINRIKQISKTARIILCTGFSDQIDNQKAQRMGIEALIMKPIVRADLVELVRLVLDKK